MAGGVATLDLDETDRCPGFENLDAIEADG